MENIVIPVLLVEDEYLIRSLIRNSVDWESLGYQIVGESEDGESALVMVEKLRPRLMIVDVNIPFIDGLELTRIVGLRYPFIKIIILTAFGNFDYAQQAIHSGVLYYILKPIDPEEFEKNLISARDKILLEERGRLLSLQSGADDSLPVAESLKVSFLNTLLADRILLDSQIIDERFKFFQISLDTEKFIVCLFSVKLQDIIDLFPAADGFEVFGDVHGRAVLLANEDDLTTRVKDKMYYEYCEKVKTVARDKGYEITIGISDIVNTPGEIKTAYLQAEKALEEEFYQGINRIYLYRDVSYSVWAADDILTITDRNPFLLLFRSRNKNAVIEKVKQYLDGIAVSKPPRQYCELACMEIITLIKEFLEEIDIPRNTFFKEGEDIFLGMSKLRTFRQIGKWLFDFIDEVFKRVEKNGGTKTQLIVKKAKKYIEWNYAKESLALDMVANYVSVSPSYISSVFKKQMGISVIEYLTEYRLKKAKEVMDEGGLTPIMEIASMAGYTDPYYFSKCFRKQYGLSPSQYLRDKKK